jgi:hypothetical protein
MRSPPLASDEVLIKDLLLNVMDDVDIIFSFLSLLFQGYILLVIV